jgi:hypothetical protein
MAVYGEFDVSISHEFTVTLDRDRINFAFAGEFEMQAGRTSGVNVSTELEFIGIVAETESAALALTWLERHFTDEGLKQLELSDVRKYAHLTGGSQCVRFAPSRFANFLPSALHG